MIVTAALALLLATAPPSGLDEARRAFAAGDYPLAERLSLDAAGAEGPAALYLAGLARFRAGRPAEALQLLDGAEAGAESPAAWRYNRGACLVELARFAEAEAAFLAAAEDPSFAPLALLNAGWAALDGGAPDRAAALAARARAAAGAGPALPLVEELERALAPAPAPAPPPPPLASWSLSASAGGGLDDDALRAASGAVERPGQVPKVESPFLTAGAGAQVSLRTGDATAVVLGYALSGQAYLDAAADDYSVLQQDLVAALRGRSGPWLGEVALVGQYALTGLTDTRGLQAAAGLRLAGAREWTGAGRQVTRAEGSFTWKDGLGEEFASLDGTRLEAAASHEGWLGWLLLRGGYRFQLERIGAVTTALPDVPAGAPGCPMPTSGCTREDVEPLSYRGHTGWVAARAEPWSWLRLDASAAAEARQGLHDLYAVVTPIGGGASTSLAPRSRDDLRAYGAAAASVPVTAWLSLSLRFDWLLNRTTLTAGRAAAQGGHAGVATVSTWDKHTLTVGAAAEW